MSEWGIEQHSTLHSTFGGAGGCFVEGLSFVGAVAIIVALANIDSTQDKPKNKIQPKVESIKQNTSAVPQDTISFIPANNAVFRLKLLRTAKQEQK